MDQKKMFRYTRIAILFGCAGLCAGFAAQISSNRYALILEDPPVSSKYQSRGEMRRTTAARSYREQVVARQRLVRSELTNRHIAVSGSVDTLLNAVFVVAPGTRVPELRSIPGVKGVVPLRRFHVELNRATQLVNAPGAWTALGGAQNAGRGLKIGILDSGIDQTHPAFQDSSLPVPSGFPICSGSDCNFTNNKVIVARSYVRQLATGTSGAADSRPDDYSARDRDGHGTAVASCAAGVTNGSAPQITGMAPQAYLGNYKIYGAPEVNDFTSDDIIIMAMEDALKDGMDVVSLSSGGPAFTGALDSGAVCQNPAGVACDLVASAFENAAKGGMVIVAAAGNEGDTGSVSRLPAFNTISSPANAPSVIGVGATTNSHFFVESVSAPGGPSNLQNISALLGSGFFPSGAVTAPLIDVTALGDNGLACTALPAGSLSGSMALIERGTCTFSNKVLNAQDAGAVGVILYMADSSNIISPDTSGANIPAAMISNAAGVALKTHIQARPRAPVTIDPNGSEQPSSAFNQLATFSSLGPTTGDNLVKPDLVATGTSMYMAVQRFDPLGALYSPTGYAAFDGTSFATPLVSGAAALVKQAHPTWTGAQIKSALVNSASQAVTTDENGNPVDVQGVGGGLLDAGAATGATVTANPPALSFGALTTALPPAQQLTLTNHGAAAVTLALSSTNTAIKLSTTTLSLGAAGSATASGAVSVSLPGVPTNQREFSGYITATKDSVVILRVPYMYLVGTGVAANLIPLTGDNFDGTVNQGIPDGILSFKLVDDVGLPVANAPVTWTALNGGTLTNSDTTTDRFGIAAAQPTLGSQSGNYSFRATAAGQTFTFSGTARVQPTIGANGIVNAADYTATLAPGSYVSIFGTGLSDFTDQTNSSTLPLAIDFATVSFDVPSAGISVPARMVYVSPGQINVQVPWELQGQTSAQVKATIDFSFGNVVTVQLADFAPAFFETATGVVAALDANYAVINPSHPAVSGQPVMLFANGLGPVDNQPASGDPAPASPLARTKGALPVVTIGGKSATVQYSGLAPGFAGLYQVNVVVPAGLSGPQTLTISIGGKTSKASGIVVK